MRRGFVVAVLMGTLLIVSVGCKKEPTEPEKQRKEFFWVDETFSLPTDNNTQGSIGYALHTGDSLKIEVTLMEGPEVGEMLITNETEIMKWFNLVEPDWDKVIFHSQGTGGGTWMIYVPMTDEEFFGIYGDSSETVKARVKLTVIRWE